MMLSWMHTSTLVLKRSGCKGLVLCCVVLCVCACCTPLCKSTNTVAKLTSFIVALLEFLEPQELIERVHTQCIFLETCCNCNPLAARNQINSWGYQVKSSTSLIFCNCCTYKCAAWQNVTCSCFIWPLGVTQMMIGRFCQMFPSLSTLLNSSFAQGLPAEVQLTGYHQQC